MRRICAEGIRLARSLRGKKWKDRKWHIERYFIKERIEAEWMVDNYRGLIDVVKRNIYEKKKDLPIGFIGRYGIALARSHAEDECIAVIAHAKRKISNKNSEPYVLVLLVEAILHYVYNHLKMSLKLLNRIPNLEILSPSYRLNAYTYLMLNYKYLGLLKEYDKYYLKLIRSSNEYDIPYGRIFAMLVDIEFLFVRSSYSKAKRKLKTAITLASEYKVYRALSEAYFLASAVYFEEEKYSKALNYLGKASKLALALASTNAAAKYSPHYALIYQKMGRYGDAVQSAKLVRNRSMRSEDTVALFYTTLILFDLYSMLGSKRASTYKRRAQELLVKIETLYRLGYFRYLVAFYDYQSKEYQQSCIEYRNAIRIYSKIDQKDDIVRSYYGLIYAYLNLGRFKYIPILLNKAKQLITNMESIELRAGYYKCRLAYYYLSRTNKKLLKHYLVLCEEIRPQIKDARLKIDFEQLLFRVNARLGYKRAAMKHLRNYHRELKQFLGNINSEHIRNEFLRKEDLILLSKELNLIKRYKKGSLVHEY
jgi:tetratricopeptide (TPR) repeat protein